MDVNSTHPYFWFYNSGLELPKKNKTAFSITTFRSCLEMENFFSAEQVVVKNPIPLHGGTIQITNYTEKLKMRFKKYRMSLKTLAILNYIEQTRTIEDFFDLPDQLIDDYLSMVFTIYWLPIIFSHIASTRRNCKVNQSYSSIVEFLTNIGVLLRLNRLSRNKLIWIVSWIQHSHILIPKNIESTFFPRRVSDLASHVISDGLIKNFEYLLSETHFNENEIISGLLLALFLHDSAEFEQAFMLTKLMFQKISMENIPDNKTYYTLKYSLICVILKSINSQIIISDPQEAKYFVDQAGDILDHFEEGEQIFKKDFESPERKEINLPPFVEQLFNDEHNTNLLHLPNEVLSNVNFSLPFVNDRQEAEEEFEGFLLLRGLLPSRASVTPINPTELEPDNFDFEELPSYLSANQKYFQSLRDPVPIVYLNNLKNQTRTPYLHIQMGFYYITMCRFKKALFHANAAIKLINSVNSQNQESIIIPHLEVHIDLLRLLFKMTILKREDNLSEKLLLMALSMAKRYYSKYSLVYIRLLFEYTNVLSLRDQAFYSQRLFRVTISLLLDTIPCPNVFLVHLLEEEAYVLYVLNYGLGDFNLALSIVNAGCICLVNLVLPPEARKTGSHIISTRQIENDHDDILKVRQDANAESISNGASSSRSKISTPVNRDSFLESSRFSQATLNRIRALILEEMALDDPFSDRKVYCLNYAVRLHLYARPVYIKNFGLFSLQTAKHFGNLGRLYQSLNFSSLAERMHLLAIFIKETLLGEEDSDVGLSVSHLAALYTFDMHKLEEGIKLHERSLRINMKFYGPTYSGHEFDYRGLQRAHFLLGQSEKANEYDNLLRQWHELRVVVGTQQITQRLDVNLGWSPSIENINEAGGALTNHLFLKTFLAQFKLMTEQVMISLEKLFCASLLDPNQLSNTKNMELVIAVILSLSDDLSRHEATTRSRGAN